MELRWVLTETQHLNSTENYRRSCLTSPSLHRYALTIINKHYHFITSDRFPVPVRSAVKSPMQPQHISEQQRAHKYTTTHLTTLYPGRPG